jgi:hypothetical protein
MMDLLGRSGGPTGLGVTARYSNSIAIGAQTAGLGAGGWSFSS